MWRQEIQDVSGIPLALNARIRRLGVLFFGGQWKSLTFLKNGEGEGEGKVVERSWERGSPGF